MASITLGIGVIREAPLNCTASPSPSCRTTTPLALRWRWGISPPPGRARRCPGPPPGRAEAE
jgi:hypothetical protein